MNQKPIKGIIIGLSVISIVLAILWLMGVFESKNPLDSTTKRVQLNLQFHHLNGAELIKDEIKFNSYAKSKPVILELLTNNYKRLDSNDSTFLDTWKSFYNQDYVQEIETEIAKEFPNYKKESKDLLDIMKRLKFQFPNKQYPIEIIFTNSNFGGNVYLENGTILVGIERYIGGNKDIIQKSLPPDAFPQWLKSGFEKKYLYRDIVMSTLIFNNTIPKTNTEYLIDKIVEWGKICVLTEMALRLKNEDINPEIVLRWTKAQLNWAEENEKTFWSYLSKKDLLFSSKEKTKAFILNNGPYTIGFSEKSPDRMGQYIGWKMVRNYAFKEGLSLPELVKLDYKIFLKQYNP